VGVSTVCISACLFITHRHTLNVLQFTHVLDLIFKSVEWLCDFVTCKWYVKGVLILFQGWSMTCKDLNGENRFSKVVSGHT
jgi:hypothetical protein